MEKNKENDSNNSLISYESPLNGSNKDEEQGRQQQMVASPCSAEQLSGSVGTPGTRKSDISSVQSDDTFSKMAAGITKNSFDAVSEHTTKVTSTVIHHATTIVEVVHIWASVASIHGVPFMLDKNFRLWRKLIWAALVALSAFGMSVQISALVKDYRRHAVNTNPEVVAMTRIDFPEIVLCNHVNINSTLAVATNLTEPKTRQELVYISQQLDEFVIYASFQGTEVNVTTESFQPIITTRGLCFRFQTDKFVSVPGALPGAGRYADEDTDGLIVYLQVKIPSYPKDSMAAFIYVAAKNTTEPSQMPVVIAEPGKYGIVGLVKTVVNRETEIPWATCNITAPSWYTREKCRTQCLHEAVYAENGCIVWGDPRRGVDFCPPADPVSQAASARAQECDELNCALPPCHEERYATRVSSIKLPTNQPLFENIAAVSINYESMTVETITEEKAMTLAQLLGSVGGAMGLFLGISTLSLIELVGELVTFRLLPRLLCGDTRLYGIGSKEH